MAAFFSTRRPSLSRPSTFCADQGLAAQATVLPGRLVPGEPFRLLLQDPLQKQDRKPPHWRRQRSQSGPAAFGTSLRLAECLKWGALPTGSPGAESGAAAFGRRPLVIATEAPWGRMGPVDRHFVGEADQQMSHPGIRTRAALEGTSSQDRHSAPALLLPWGKITALAPRSAMSRPT